MLLESRARGERSATSTVASFAAHTALIAGAVYATAQGRVEAGKPPEVVRPVYFPTQATQAPKPVTTRHQTSTLPRWRFVVPAIDVAMPAVDVILPESASTDFNPKPIGVLPATGVGNERRDMGDRTFLAEQVEKQVAVIPGNATPRYPELLRAAGIEGEVVARFVVDEEGRVEGKSIRFTRSDNQLFEDAVRAALARARFVPAEIGGKKVRQLVEMPFMFNLSR